MDKRMAFIGTATLLVVLLLTGITVAQTSANFDLSWHVLAGGGSRTAGTTYAINCTIGQGTVGWAASDSYGTGVGYWHGVAGKYRFFLPLVLKGYS